jgi:hypothetical protein
METEIIEEVNKVLEDKINTIIDIEYIPVSMLKEEMLKKLYSNDNVDVIDCVPQKLETYIQDLNIADLTDILPIYYPELFEPGIDLSNLYTDGRIYTFPRIMARPFQERICLMIDREFYESAGSPSVETMEDVIALYDYGVEHENKDGVMFLDGKANRYFLCPFTYFLGLYLQSNGYTDYTLDALNVYFYAEKDDEIIDLFETDVLEDCYSILSYMCDKNAIDQNDFGFGYWPPDPEIKQPGLIMALTSINEISFESHYGIRDHYEFNCLYKIISIGDYEIYPSKYAYKGFLICDNGNADRAVIALRLMYEDPDINRLLTYGVENKHYKLIDSRIQSIMNEAKFNVYRWWPGIINEKYLIPFVYSPEETKKYYQYLYTQTKQVIPGVSNGKLSSIIMQKKDDKETAGFILERKEIFSKFLTYKEYISKGITYNEIVNTLRKEEQKKLLDRIRADLEEEKRLK